MVPNFLVKCHAVSSVNIRVRFFTPMSVSGLTLKVLTR